jgi:hypothetical protein
VPEIYLLLGINTNVSVFASSGDLSKLAWELTPLATNAESKIDIIVSIGSNYSLIVSDINS